ncbi:hypothetical protein CGJ08_24615 [Vibrio parahaemolyticus]|uniref:TRADD-N-associated membrane domain-containing protein n=1 Tax=Vibrio parahaemolyticus TaxID=670 RepID=UPI0011235A0F|nr:hypothetical protein [Vibrio parahaemolyticus]TOG06554.1 hypothetical protein CGJ08_24615 [Vibrio parahaemolyticus]
MSFEAILQMDKWSLFLSAAAITIATKTIGEVVRQKQVMKQIADAEERAFKSSKNETKATNQSNNRSSSVDKKEEEMKNLFNLYTKQVEAYQNETRRRANTSFFFAILSMVGGLLFVFWGGSFILSSEGADHAITGASISAIGGGVSAYITKTFLDVHKLSLTQLNRYFKQPVINEHILMAQRLADDVGDPAFKKESYEKLIISINQLIIDTNGNNK